MRTGLGTNVLTLNCTSEIENYGNSIFFFLTTLEFFPTGLLGPVWLCCSLEIIMAFLMLMGKDIHGT